MRDLEVRPMTHADLDVVGTAMPLWSPREYLRRLAHPDTLAQVLALSQGQPVGRGMLVLPGHPEWSISAWREGVSEVRDVAVLEGWRRRGVATAMMGMLEEEATERGFARIGLSVALDASAAPARALYERLGYAHAHGPFISSADLAGPEGPIPVGAAMTYLIKQLGP
jgi:ribosomal protein S18 acetylase RimI-like enzyme